MRRGADAHRGLEVQQQLFEDIVVGGVHDRQMKLAVGLLGVQAAFGGSVFLEPRLQNGYVVFGAVLGGGAADSPLQPTDRIAAVP